MAKAPKIKLRRELLSLTSYYEMQTEIADLSMEPSTVIERKTKDLADQLGCSESRAERIILGKEAYPTN